VEQKGGGSVILERTHANRWVARRSRRRPVQGVITRVPGPESTTVFKTYALTDEPSERLLLRDAATLEVAFALLIAHAARTFSPDPGAAVPPSVAHAARTFSPDPASAVAACPA